jgi:cell division protein FtsL
MKNLLKSIGWAVLIVGLTLALAFGFNKAIKDTYKLSEKDSLMIENLKLDNELKKLQLQKTTTP